MHPDRAEGPGAADQAGAADSHDIKTPMHPNSVDEKEVARRHVSFLRT
jgi:hypothetical protein